MPTFKLQSSDGKIFDVDVRIAESSVTIQNMFNATEEDEKEGEIVPIITVKSEILDKIICWAEHHNFPSSDERNGTDDDISSWDADFLKVVPETLLGLANAANFLDMAGLLEMTQTAIANIMRDKTGDEIRKMFNIKNNFTPAQLEEVRTENSWAREVM